MGNSVEGMFSTLVMSKELPIEPFHHIRISTCNSCVSLVHEFVSIGQESLDRGHLGIAQAFVGIAFWSEFRAHCAKQNFVGIVSKMSWVLCQKFVGIGPRARGHCAECSWSLCRISWALCQTVVGVVPKARGRKAGQRSKTKPVGLGLGFRVCGPPRNPREKGWVGSGSLGRLRENLKRRKVGWMPAQAGGGENKPPQPFSLWGSSCPVRGHTKHGVKQFFFHIFFMAVRLARAD